MARWDAPREAAPLLPAATAELERRGHRLDRIPTRAELRGRIEVRGDAASEQEADRLAEAALGHGRAVSSAASTASPGLEGPVDAGTERAIHAARGQGQPLVGSLRAPLEQALGLELGGVRVHLDERAHGLSRSLGARAFTVGQDLFFQRGEYNPATAEGRHVIAHEVAHVAQQSASGSSSLPLRRMPGKGSQGGQEALDKALEELQKKRNGAPLAKGIFDKVATTHNLDAVTLRDAYNRKNYDHPTHREKREKLQKEDETKKTPDWKLSTRVASVEELVTNNEISVAELMNVYMTSSDKNGGYSIRVRLNNMTGHVLHAHMTADHDVAQGPDPVHIKKTTGNTKEVASDSHPVPPELRALLLPPKETIKQAKESYDAAKLNNVSNEN
ncbi:eCIS core domain-containing protein [Hyalangium gracile]|uniref:eCIS core domain-containing protein n=1 Tax=Hyalangium gracile TaxID=394092 RepID=UPI001CCDA633|nr:DUF4157 domain-containing protein [Hyalangium gracile]